MALFNFFPVAEGIEHLPHFYCMFSCDFVSFCLLFSFFSLRSASAMNARMNAAATCGTIAFPYPFNLIFRASPVESAYATSTGQSGTTPRGIP